MCHLGGTFALYARLARCCKLPTPTATEQEFDTNLTRYGTKLEKGAKASVGNYVRVLCLLLLLLPSSKAVAVCALSRCFAGICRVLITSVKADKHI
jgi:hypothetical protein